MTTSPHAPIVLIEDDANDQEIITAALKELGVPNEVYTFADGNDAMEFLTTTDQTLLIIISDIRMPVLNGLAFRKAIVENEVVRRKAIPFVFLTAAVSQEIVNEAYDLSVQGFFRKPTSYSALKEQLGNILRYWTLSLHPNRLVDI